MTEYNITSDNIHIIDSYKIRDMKEMLDVLYDIRSKYSIFDCNPLLRCNKSLIREWMGHNLFYDLHLFRNHTKDVDLNTSNSFVLKSGYYIASLIYRLYN